MISVEQTDMAPGSTCEHLGFPTLTPPLSLKGLGTKLDTLRCSLEDEFHHQEVVSTVAGGVELPGLSTVYIFILRMRT